VGIVIAAALVLQVPMPPEAQPPDMVRIEDTHLFDLAAIANHGNGMTSLAWHTRNRFEESVRVSDPSRVEGFKKDCNWRSECWGKLYEVFHPETRQRRDFDYCRELTPEEVERATLDALNDLRVLLGDADYFAGQMPTPSPPMKIPYGR
jgi:hypothetical protein